MLITIFTVILLILGLVGTVIAIDRDKEVLGGATAVLFGLSGLALVIMIIAILCSNVNVPGQVARLESERAAIIYQVENKTYLNDNNLGTNELFTQIGTFNGKVLGGRASKSNPWVRWFYSPAYYQVESIDLKGENHGQ